MHSPAQNGKLCPRESLAGDSGPVRAVLSSRLPGVPKPSTGCVLQGWVAPFFQLFPVIPHPSRVKRPLVCPAAIPAAQLPRAWLAGAALGPRLPASTDLLRRLHLRGVLSPGTGSWGLQHRPDTAGTPSGTKTSVRQGPAAPSAGTTHHGIRAGAKDKGDPVLNAPTLGGKQTRPKLLPASRDTGETLSCPASPRPHSPVSRPHRSDAHASSAVTPHASALTKRAQEFQRNRRSLVVLPRLGARLPTALVRAGRIPAGCVSAGLGRAGWERQQVPHPRARQRLTRGRAAAAASTHSRPAQIPASPQGLAGSLTWNKMAVKLPFDARPYLIRHRSPGGRSPARGQPGWGPVRVGWQRLVPWKAGIKTLLSSS